MRRTVQITLSVLVSVFFVWLSLRGTSLSEVGQALAQADLRFLAAYSCFLVAVHVVRTVRWGLLLEPLAKVRFRNLNPLAAVGFMALMVMPLRLGELARPVLVAEHLGLRRSAALASVVVERIVDGLVIGLLLLTLLWVLGPRAAGESMAAVKAGGLIVAGIFGGGLVALVLAYHNRALAIRLVERWIGRISSGLANRLAGMLSAFAEGLQVVPTAGKLAQFLLLTATYWTLAGLGLTVVAQAFGFTLTPLQGFTVLGLQVIGVMIPAGPGMVGTFQFFTALGLSLFHGEGVEPATAAAYAHTVWAMTFGQHVLFGLFFVSTGRVPLGSMVARFRADTAAS